MLSQPFPRTTTNPAGRASTIRSPSTTTRRGAPLSRAVASTTVRFAVSADTPRASMAQRAKAGLPPATVTVMPVGTLESGHATAISSLSGTRRMPPPTDSPHACSSSSSRSASAGASFRRCANSAGVGARPSSVQGANSPSRIARRSRSVFAASSILATSPS